MKPSASFDFRDLIGIANFAEVDPKDCERLIIGAASCDIGIALVALKEGELGEAPLDAYAHVVIGPIEDDWEHIATLIDQLRNVFEPPIISQVLLRVEEGEDRGTNKLIFERLQEVFPEELRLVRGERVAQWAKQSPCRISLPDIPEDDVWTRKLLFSAAETAVFLERGAKSLGRPDPIAKFGVQQTEKSADERELREGPVTLPLQAPVAARAPRRNTPSATALNFTNPVLHIVTVREGLDDEYVLDEERTCSLTLADRSATGLAALQLQLKELFESWGVDSVSMRVGDNTGPYQLRPNAYKIEAALQLLDSVELEELSVAQVTGFARRFDHLLPEPQPHLRQQATRAGQRHAIRAAAMSLRKNARGD